MRDHTPRRTKIVCTLGPATSEPAKIGRLISAGMNVARINRSHGTQEEASALIRAVREQAERLDEHVAVLLDLQGPKIRTGRLRGGSPVLLRDRAEFTITTRDLEGTAEMVSTDYSGLPRDATPGSRILLSDGLIELQVLDASDTEVHTRVVHGGMLAERQGINLPGTIVSAPALTEKDRGDLVHGVAEGVDYIALSFVRRPEDVAEAARLVRELGADTPIIAKIEKPQALEHLNAILRLSNGVMVARGDMGIELPPEEVPLRQKQIIEAANVLQVPVITATQMLESMIHNPRPTRAEASDVANAIWDGTDAVMLSGETAVGDHPVEAVMMMDRIARAAEQEPRYVPDSPAAHDRVSPTHSISLAARQITFENREIRAIAAFTRSGHTASLISKDRPPVPVLGYTPNRWAARRMALYWGVTPILTGEVRTVGGMFDAAEEAAKRLPFLDEGDPLVIVGRIPLDTAGVTNFLTIHRINAPRPQA